MCNVIMHSKQHDVIVFTGDCYDGSGGGGDVGAVVVRRDISAARPSNKWRPPRPAAAVVVVTDTGLRRTAGHLSVGGERATK